MTINRIKINNFLKMSQKEKIEWHDKCNISMNNMWMTQLERGGIYNDNQYLVIEDNYVIHKTGRYIDGVQMTDESCAWYAKDGRNYINDNGEKVGSNVNDIYNYHYSY